VHGVIQNKSGICLSSEARTLVDQTSVGNEILVRPIWIPSKVGFSV